MRQLARCVLCMTLVIVPFLAAWPAPKDPKVKYDPATEARISGTIDEVKEFECPVSGTVGYHLSLRTGGGTVMVHVAASRFMREYEVLFEKGQHIEVVGSKVKLEDGEDAFLAREITRGQNTYAFRDKQGNPLW